MFSLYQHIWLCGLPASGKTTVLTWLDKNLPKINLLNDSLPMLEFIRADQKEMYHRKPTPDSFILTDSVPAHHAIKHIISQVEQSRGFNVIELSRGIDQEEEIDLSYQYFFSQLPTEIARESLFLYLQTPFAERLERNQQRPAPQQKLSVLESFHCPTPAMERFFERDDFFTAVKETEVDVLIINNDQAIDRLFSKLAKLFLFEEKK